MRSAKKPTTATVRVALAIVLGAGIVGVMGACSFAAGPGLDASRWLEHRIQLSSIEFAFRVPPGGGSKAKPSYPTITRLDLERDLTKAKPGVAVFGHVWDWEGWFWQGVFGSLKMIVGVSSRPADYDKDLTAIENLEGLIRRDLGRTYDQRNAELRQKGQAQFTVTLPESYQRIPLHGREWLVYSLGGQLHRTIYVIPVTPTRYLSVSLDFTDNSRGYTTTWRQEAQVVADHIIASFELREPK